MTPTPEQLTSALQKVIKEEMAKIIASEVANAQKRVEERLHAEVDRLTLRIMTNYQIERFGTELRITVQKLATP